MEIIKKVIDWSYAVSKSHKSYELKIKKRLLLNELKKILFLEKKLAGPY